jgi:hypothetical protein
MGRGRRPEAELVAIRARIETLLLSGLRAPEIHRALTGPENPAPIELSERQVRYLNVAIKAQDQLARLRGLYAPTQAELSGPAGAPLGLTVTLADHPAEHLEPAEEARRLRQLAADLEVDAEPAEETE